MNRILFIFSFSLLILGCQDPSSTQNPTKEVRLFCDAESTTLIGSKKLENDGITFGSASYQSDAFSRSGEHCVLVNEEQKYGFATKLQGVVPGDAIEISVWRHQQSARSGHLVVSDSSSVFYNSGSMVIAVENDWKLMKMMVYVDQPVDHQELTCYVLNSQPGDSYFDDFEVIHHKQYTFPEFESTSGLQILLDPDKMRKLKKKREDALEKGVLFSSDQDWVPGSMVFEEDTFKVELRLKGDWLDHLKGFKWSYRIKVKKGAFKGMRTFSLHTPTARNYLDEWVIHKMYEEVDVLTTRYGFVPVTINGKSIGLYAYEEHFDKQLVEHKKRREGPLMKLDESAHFQLAAAEKGRKEQYSRAITVELATITPFKSGRTMKSEALRKLFFEGQKLLHQHQFNLFPTHEIYEVNKLGMLYAIADLGGTTHGLGWHNQRFYMNPVLAKLEPIAYDCFTGWPEEYQAKLSGEIALKHRGANNNYFSHLPFQDSVFVEKYIENLERVSSPEFLDAFFEKHRKSIAHYESLIAREFSGYQYYKEHWYQSATALRHALVDYKQKVGSQTTFQPGHPLELDDAPWPWQPVDNQAIKVFLSDSSQGVFKLQVINTFHEPLELVGFGTAVSMFYPLATPEKLEPFYLDQKTYNYSTKGNWCYYRLPGQDALRKIAVLPWPIPEGKTVRQSIEPNIPKAFTLDGTNLVVSGNLTLTQNIFIPSGYRLVFKSGTKLNLRSCFFISESPVFFEGTEEAPIEVVSHNAQGFTVLQASERSRISHTTFTGFNTLLLDGWTLTGGVNFYESDVDMDHLLITENVCEDALNIIRSDFAISHSEISHTFSDGFDADFCTGRVENSSFHHSGNDCIDFSTSEISISDCVIFDAGDKAISGGENSRLTIDKVQISRSNIGVAAKDLTVITLSESSVDHCRYGYAIYQKKNEFGPASIEANHVEIQATDTLYLIEVGSQLKLDGKVVEGESVIDLDSLYGL